MKSPVKGALVAVLATVCTSIALPLTALPAHAAGGLTIERTSRTPANPNGWNNATVTATWRCTWDNGYTYDISREVSDEGADQSVTGTCEQPDGSRVQDTVDGINIDETGPDVEFLGRTSANAAGWNKTDVTVRWTCTDDLSGVVSDTVSKTLTKEGHDKTVEGTCRDLADNDTTGAEVDRISIDKTLPNAELTDRTAPNANGWNNADVTVSWTCGDDMSGPAFDDSTVVFSTEGENGAATGKCVDKAGNVYQPTEPVNLDKTAPTTTLTSRTAPNAQGWNNGPVDLEWTCSDAVSGPENAGDAAGFTDEGEGQSATGHCTDLAGNTSSNTVDDVDIDLTAPTVEWTAGPKAGSEYYFGFVPQATCATADLLSGPAPCVVTDSSTTVGPHTLTATATDNADNTGTDTRDITVKSWTGNGTFLGRKAVGATKPKAVQTLKFEVFAGTRDVTSVSLVDAQFTQNQISCATHKRITPTDDKLTLKTVYTSGGIFAANWKAPAAKGCYAVRATLADGSKRYASFQVK